MPRLKLLLLILNLFLYSKITFFSITLINSIILKYCSRSFSMTYYNINRKIDIMENQRDEHRIHLIVYHLIWVPRRRKVVLIGDIAKDCKTLIEQKCSEQGWSILELAINLDHVHLFIRTWPTISAAEIIKQCKRLTSHELRKQYTQLLKLPSLWTRSYFASMAGNISSETIQQYIVAQRKF